MGIHTDEVSILRDVTFDFSLDRILDMPPFPRWRQSQYSKTKLENTARRLRSEVRDELDPRALYRILPVDDSGVQQYSPPDPIREADYVCCVLITAGEFQSSIEGSKQLFDDLVRDAIENVALQLLTEEVGTRIREAAHEQGWATTRLFAPGSGSVNWPIENRAYIFEVLPAEAIGVKLTENGLVEPSKTISCVLGMGPSVEQAPSLVSCDGCPRIAECPYADTPEIFASG